MRVISVRAKITTACIASEGYDVEMKLYTDNAETLFLHVNEYDGIHYTVAKKSIFDYMTGKTNTDPHVKFLEEYDSWGKAQKSAYKPYFAAMRRILKTLG